MSVEVLSHDEVAALEKTIDQNFASTPPPASTYHRAAWIVLSFNEDVFRTAIDSGTFLSIHDSQPAELRSGDHLVLKISDQIDTSKFALHQALKLFRKTLKQETNPVNLEFTGVDEWAVFGFLQKAERYAEANRQFPSYHEGFTSAVRHPDGSIEFAEPTGTRPYTILETLSWGEWKRAPRDEGLSSMDLFIMTLNHHGPAKPAADAIAEKSKIVKDKLKYTFITTLAAQLQGLLPHHSWLIPADWTFPWGTVADTLRLYRALCSRAIYHLIAVHSVAEKAARTANLRGQTCLTLSSETLIDDLSPWQWTAPWQSQCHRLRFDVRHRNEEPRSGSSADHSGRTGDRCSASLADRVVELRS